MIAKVLTHTPRPTRFPSRCPGGEPPKPVLNFPMRLTPSSAANAFAWAILIGLISVAFVLVVILGPFGLILLGLLTLFVCTSASLREDTPTWGTDILKARTASDTSPEQRAALREERDRNLAPMRYYRWYGVVLTVAGIAGFAWQQLR
jgi:hypothetical protein